MKRLLSLAFLAGCGARLALAQDAPAAATTADLAALQINLNYVWTMVAAMLVFFMQTGFALVEAGATRAKNAANILMKNFMDAGAGGIMFFFVGFGLMFGTSIGGWIGGSGFMLTGLQAPEGYGDAWIYMFFFFQAVFAATAATIVSGAVAERTKFAAYLVFSVVMTAIIYPVFGSWAWGGLLNGGGWLEGIGFLDFAGSTVVHSVGGWAALAGAMVVGPRIGKYGPDGKPRHIPGHSIPYFGVGVFILWFGWFGFNAGSTTTGDSSVALIAANTFLAACGGAVAAMTVMWIRKGRPDVHMTLNGVLGGLVGITAGCDIMTPGFALLTGLLAGVILVYASEFIERFVDDAVGAVSVHAVCGVWGTLAVALFHVDGFSLSQLGIQALGALTAFVWAFGISFIAFKIIAATIGMRAEEGMQELGLDHTEHSINAYPDFTVGVSAGDGERMEIVV